MDNIRRRSNTLPVEKKRKSDELKKPAYVEDNDNWLEDDLAATAKRRKSSASTIDSLLYTSNTRKSPESGLETQIEVSSDDSGESFVARPKPKRKTQVSLINVGFSRSKTSPTKKRSPVKKPSVEQVKLTEADSSSPSLGQSHHVKQIQMLSVDVRIEEKLYRVPVPAAGVNNCTIKWLAEEAAKRYFK